jgi:hypothetical protein
MPLHNKKVQHIKKEAYAGHSAQRQMTISGDCSQLNTATPARIGRMRNTAQHLKATGTRANLRILSFAEHLPYSLLDGCEQGILHHLPLREKHDCCILGSRILDRILNPALHLQAQPRILSRALRMEDHPPVLGRTRPSGQHKRSMLCLGMHEHVLGCLRGDLNASQAR